MSMKEWAKREIEIAVGRERAADGSKEGEFSYGGACYESAYKAFDSLLEDGHSGMSIGFTKTILNRLIDGKPLTPIEDVDDIWENVSRFGLKEKHMTYQCKRMYSLFKYVYPNGSVEYRCTDRYYCRDIVKDYTYTCSLCTDILDELYPITMPYIPADRPYVFLVEDLKLQDTPGDSDTMVIHYLQKPDGTVEELNRYYTEDITGRMVQITAEEYEKLVDNYIHRGGVEG